jgi:HAD superfamily hydrolase (TIGR01450 family)
MKKCFSNLRHVALDMDGTIYKGSTLFDFTKPFLVSLKEMGVNCTFLTNNPSKSTREYLTKLHHFGISADADELYTSTHSTIEYLRVHLPQVKRLFALGTPGMCAELTEAGFTLCHVDEQKGPDAVVVGFDPTLTYTRLCRAAWWIQQGKMFIATNPDLVCPTDKPTVLVDCGSICAALTAATGRKPNKVLGKPDPEMLRGILQRHSLRPRELAMVGDRLYTDVVMAQRAGVMSVLVLTGETTAEAAAMHLPAPDLIVPSLAEFGEVLRHDS